MNNSTARKMTFVNMSVSRDFFGNVPWTVNSEKIPYFSFGKSVNNIKVFAIGPFAVFSVTVNKAIS